MLNLFYFACFGSSAWDLRFTLTNCFLHLNPQSVCGTKALTGSLPQNFVLESNGEEVNTTLFLKARLWKLPIELVSSRNVTSLSFSKFTVQRWDTGLLTKEGVRPVEARSDFLSRSVYKLVFKEKNNSLTEKKCPKLLISHSVLREVYCLQWPSHKKILMTTNACQLCMRNILNYTELCSVSDVSNGHLQPLIKNILYFFNSLTWNGCFKWICHCGFLDFFSLVGKLVNSHGW